MAVRDLGDRRCLMTGAASGIGRATAIAAAGKGADLYLTDIAAEGLDAVAAEIAAAGGRVSWHHAADVSDHDAVVAMAEEIHAAHGSMDVVMNVAGVSTWGTISELQHDDWQQMIDVNLLGPIGVLESFVPPMIEAGRGGHVVSLVCPGGVRTPLVGTARIVGVDRESPGIRKLIARFEKRAVTPEHVAERILAGVERDRYLVFTSNDIRVTWWLQRYFPPAYELIMRKMNDHLVKAAGRG